MWLKLTVQASFDLVALLRSKDNNFAPHKALIFMTSRSPMINDDIQNGLLWGQFPHVLIHEGPKYLSSHFPWSRAIAHCCSVITSSQTSEINTCYNITTQKFDIIVIAMQSYVFAINFRDLATWQKMSVMVSFQLPPLLRYWEFGNSHNYIAALFWEREKLQKLMQI